MVELGKLYRNRITTTIGPQNQIDVSIGCAMTGVPKLALDLIPIGIVPDALDALQSGSLKPLYNSGDKANDAGNAVDTASKAAEVLSKTLPFLKPIAKKLGPAGIAISLYKAGRDFHNCAR